MKLLNLAVVFLLAASPTWAQQPQSVLEFSGQDPTELAQGKKAAEQPKQLPKIEQPKQPLPPQPPVPLDQQLQVPNIFAQAQTEQEVSSGFNPQMMGDLPALFGRQNFRVTVTQTTTTAFNPSSSTFGPPSSSTSTTTFTQNRSVLVPLATLGGFNVVENESPRPQDRVFTFYNYFDNLRSPAGSAPAPLAASSQTVQTTYAGTTTTTTSTLIAGVPQPRINVNREFFGFEKTFLDGRASVEMRLPLFQQQGSGLNAYDVGDLTIVTRYAFILDNPLGNVATVGLAVTVPTGPAIQTTAGNFRDVFIQPWGGYIFNFDRFYIQGIHSVAIPTNIQDVTLAFNSVGFNYWLYRAPRSQFFNLVVPTVEAHVTTPLNHRDINANDPIFAPDLLVMTGGVHFGLGRNSLLTLGAATPVTGPTIFTVEGFAQFNWRF